MENIGYICLALSLALTACATGNGEKLHSEWKVLGEADQVPCYPWPLGVGDLDVLSVMNIGKGLADDYFLSEGRTRKLEPTRYLAAASGDFSVQADEIMALSWGEHASYVGEFILGSGLMVLLKTANAKGGGSLELRELPANIVRYQSGLLSSDMRNLRLHSAKESHFWLSYNRTSSGETDIISMARGTLESGGTLSLSAPLERSFGEGSEFIALGDGGIINVDLDFTPPHSHRNSQFKFTRLFADGALAQESILSVQVDQRVESWAVTLNGQAMWLAFVDGDSLLGNAKLRVAGFEGVGLAPVLKWQHEVDLSYAHVGGPVWLRIGSEDVLVIPKWLDAESTLEAFRISPVTISSMGHWGVFKEATNFLSFFPSSARHPAGVSISQDDWGGKATVSLCRLGTS